MKDEKVTFRVTCDAVRNMIAQVQEIFPHTVKFDFELSMDGESDRPMIVISCLNLETGNILEAYFTCTPPKFGEMEDL